jgi:uncharacterized protein (UPF0276 family)
VEFAVNISPAAVELLESGQIAVDRLKCPAWPDLIASASGTHPLYVHFPLSVGRGIGAVIDTEKEQAADLDAVERMLVQTGTPYVNAHLAPRASEHPKILLGSEDRAHQAHLASCMIADLRPLVERFGAERVVLENVHHAVGAYPRAAYLPGAITQVVEETGCGLLLDLSHARLAAYHLGLDSWDYLQALPLSHLRELHLTGIQRFDAAWQAQVRLAGVDPAVLGRYTGRLMDHLPLTEEDWAFTARALGHIHRGDWGRPRLVALECGGIGSFWQVVVDGSVLREQVPRLYNLVKEGELLSVVEP